MGKKRHLGSVGAYLLRENSAGVWETVVHRRSSRVDYAREQVATPGGFLDKKDTVDARGIMQESGLFLRGMQRELLEETDFCVDSIDPSDVFELPCSNETSTTDKNFRHTSEDPFVEGHATSWLRAGDDSWWC